MATRVHAAVKPGGLSGLVHVYLAVLKQGNMSDAFAEKIINDLGIINLQTQSDACRMFYSRFGTSINETNIAAITEHWT